MNLIRDTRDLSSHYPAVTRTTDSHANSRESDRAFSFKAKLSPNIRTTNVNLEACFEEFEAFFEIGLEKLAEACKTRQGSITTALQFLVDGL